MMLNLEKCMFEIKAEKFLCFMLTHQGIEANPKKCQTIAEIQNPRT